MQSYQCVMCRHYLGSKGGDIPERWTTETSAVALAKCEAFPKGIPHPIFEGEVTHNKPYPGDNGIQFERR